MPQDYFFSVIIPVYNRPIEVDELLQSLTAQTFQGFEIIIVEDGSSIDCKEVIQKYTDSLDISYHYKENGGPGIARNYGVPFAKGKHLVFFDSDCLIPPQYFEEVITFLQQRPVDAFGGPDRSHPSFTPIQKAISYAMTSFFTTGGIRGSNMKNPQNFHPRSFNMCFTKEVYSQTKGFGMMRFGEDVDLSLRILAQGYTTALIPNAYVYHKRRTDFKKFFKQVHNSGIARLHLYKLHPKSLKIVHFLPTFFTLGILACLLLSMLMRHILPLLPISIYATLVFADALLHYKESFRVSLLAIPASFVQLMGYGLGFIRGFWKRVIRRQDNFQAFEDNFYK